MTASILSQDRPPPAGRVSNLPLCVDLDGTLVRADLLVEGIAASRLNRHVLQGLLALRRSGIAAFKRCVAQQSPPDPNCLPYNEALIAWLRQQRENGRRLVLATASDATVAESISQHLGLFDEIVASDGVRNLKGPAKAEALVRRFGKEGFSYVGDSRADLPVWKAAGNGATVNASRSVAAAARRLALIETEFRDRDPAVLAAVQALRPYQWVKNVLVFVPIFTAHVVHEWTVWNSAAILFVAFCLIASGIYLVNDMADVAADRRHPRKRFRPLARGALSLPAAAALACVLLGAGFVLGAAADALPMLVLYVGCSLAYTYWLKEKPLADVFLLAALYIIRIAAGGEAIGHYLSLWLLGFCSFLFLDLALLKRATELMQAAARGEEQVARRGYRQSDLQLIQMFGASSAFASSVVLALFVQSDATAEAYASPGLLWGIVPLVLFWQCRVWLSTARGNMQDDPILYAARDWVSWVAAALSFALLGIAKVLTVPLPL